MPASDVSVIVPTFNRASWLREALRSILQQTVPAAEVLVVDDGSTDDIAEVVREFAGRVRGVRQENAGVSAARNRGIQETRGTLVAFCDSDDVWEPSKLEVQLAALRRFADAGWAISESTLMNYDGSAWPGSTGFEGAFGLFESGLRPEDFFSRHLSRGDVAAAGATHVVYHGDAYEALFHGNFALPSSAVVRRSLIDAVGGFDVSWRHGEETEFFHRVAASSPVALVMTPLVHFRHGHSDRLVSGANTERLIFAAVKSVEQAIHLRPGPPESTRSAFHAGRAGLYERLAYFRLSELDTNGAREAIRAAWSTGAPKSRHAMTIFMLSLLPPVALRALHRLKSMATGGGGQAP